MKIVSVSITVAYLVPSSPSVRERSLNFPTVLSSSCRVKFFKRDSRSPPLSLLLDQMPEPAAGDQMSPDVVQPDGLTQRSQPFQRFTAHASVSLLSSAATFARRRR